MSRGRRLKDEILLLEDRLDFIKKVSDNAAEKEYLTFSDWLNRVLRQKPPAVREETRGGSAGSRSAQKRAAAATASSEGHHTHWCDGGGFIICESLDSDDGYPVSECKQLEASYGLPAVRAQVRAPQLGA